MTRLCHKMRKQEFYETLEITGFATPMTLDARK